ncbi:MAG: PTS sugar transporter subunit IIA [Deltaproteobacteria bacterium]|nr:PTS sugar transporter subunit IIA [Deltaproteobacteria bacterium]
MTALVGDRPGSFLRMIRRSQRGRFKIYLGYGAGVGKTYQMLLEGHRMKAEGIDVVIGLVETHGRPDTAKLIEGLEVVPKHKEEYRGISLEEMDVDAIIARKPQVALIDELAHTNAPGNRNPKRYQDVQEILAAGIHVITTLNVQHLESLYDTVEKNVHVKVRERIPDWILGEADEIVNVDISPEDLQKRLHDGKIYPSERVQTALSNFFTSDNLETLRELTLRELVSQIDTKRREHFDDQSQMAPDQVMVCLSSRGPNSARLLRYASRLAGRLNRNWYALYVQTPSEEPTVIDPRTQTILSETLTLAKQLGAIVFTYKGSDITETLLRFAKEYRVGHIVIGTPGPIPFWKRIMGKRSLVENLIQNATGLTIVVLDTREPLVAQEDNEESKPGTVANYSGTHVPNANVLRLTLLLSPNQIVLWDNPINKRDLLEQLVKRPANGTRTHSVADILTGLMKREDESSTFFNEGVAFPHLRLTGIGVPLLALGIASKGVSDVLTELPVKLVFLILSPEEDPSLQVRLLGMLSRLVRNKNFVEQVVESDSSERAWISILNFEKEVSHK